MRCSAESLESSRIQVQFSRHTECDELIQADLLKAEKGALENKTKLHKKKSTLRSLTKGITKPMKPIKNLFQSKDSKDAKDKATAAAATVKHLSYKDYPQTQTEIAVPENETSSK